MMRTTAIMNKSIIEGRHNMFKKVLLEIPFPATVPLLNCETFAS